METIRNNADTPPDRLNEDWRFGRPHVHAAELLELIEKQRGDEGELSLEPTADLGGITIGDAALQADHFASIGSEYLVKQALQAASDSMALSICGSNTAETPFCIRCEAKGFFAPQISIVIEPGAHVHIVEQHLHHEKSTMFCLRHYTVMPGASLSLELREEGSGSSRAMNISRICCLGDCDVRHITTHKGHLWAREETTAELTQQNGASPNLLLLSANHLQGEQWLDQRTRQLHFSPGAKSRLLYKNVLDDKATAIFGGNIRVELGAHDTDAYLSNLNMMLSEQATVHSLPGLEILADRVRCSHGSATAPIDTEQLFYLLARGIPESDARSILAEAFLANVHQQFLEAPRSID